jgi:asparagine N-glycosylation enzyme membrane subunit Stt3
MEQSRPEKLVRWCIFNVLIALAPLVISYLALGLDRKEPSLALVTARGELLLISTTIASAAIGELLPSGRNYATLKVTSGGACMLLVLLSSLFFSAIQARREPSEGAIFAASISLFSFTLLASFSAVYLAYEGKQP